MVLLFVWQLLFLVALLLIPDLVIPTATIIDDTTSTATNDDEQYDVLIFGANAAGVGAAVTASANGKYRVKVVEPLTMIGGMAAAGGVALMNQGGCGLTGLSKNWSTLVASYYGLPDGEPMPYPPFPRMMESERAFWELIQSSPTIDTQLGCHVVAVHKPERASNGRSSACLGHIGRVDFICHQGHNNHHHHHHNQTTRMSVEATYIIDASYDGDIMTMAGVDHASGRESRGTYNESLAGVQWKEHSPIESFALQNITIDPYYKDNSINYKTSTSNHHVLKYIDPHPLAPDGSGDDKLMSFQYLACLSTTPGNRVPFMPPIHYHADDFLLLLRQSQAVMANGKYPLGPPLAYFGDVQCYDPIVEQVTGNKDCMFCCGTAPVNADQPGLNQGWAHASYQQRQEIAQQYKYYLQGSLYFMANDPRMPEFTRQDAQRYGYCKDEYADHGHFPPQLYVRISNRLRGQSFLTQNNIANPRNKPDAVAMGCWPFDQHTMSRHVVPDPNDPTGKQKIVRNEGFFRAKVAERGETLLIVKDNEKDQSGRGCCNFPWYDVPFGVMVPAKQTQASNLLVPVCISASSVAYASTRIENMYMDLGSAAGVAVVDLLDRAAAAKDSNNMASSCPWVPVQQTNISAVQHVLQTVYKQRFHGPDIEDDVEGSLGDVRHDTFDKFRIRKDSISTTTTG